MTSIEWSPSRVFATHVPSFTGLADSSYSTNDDDTNDNSHSISHWEAALISMALILALAAIFVGLVKFFQYRWMKREWLRQSELDATLTWDFFKQRCKEQRRQAVRDEEAQEERETAEAAVARRTRREERRRQKQERYNRKMARMQGHGDDLILMEQREPPPYSAIMDPEREVGMKPW